MDKKKLLIPIFVLVLLALPVLGVGTCSLNKFHYDPLESALFSCFCTSAAEQNRPGFIVWRNATTVLQSVAVNSGSCLTSLFSDSYTFLSGTNYSGNVTFSLNADGTGSPLSWEDVGDVRSDTFSVSNASVFDCMISDVEASSIVLGWLSAVKVTVTDGITGNALVHAECSADGYASDGTPLVFEPYTDGFSTRFSGSGGEVGFQHLMIEDYWLVDSNYLFEFHCHCINGTDHACYDETTGEDAGFKSCSTSVAFTTSHDDYRNDGSQTLSIIIGFLVIIAYLVFMGFSAFSMAKFDMNKTMFWVALISFGLAMLEVIFLSGLLYINGFGLSLTGLLRINFYSFALIGFGIGTVTLAMILIRAFDDGKGGGIGKW